MDGYCCSYNPSLELQLKSKTSFYTEQRQLGGGSFDQYQSNPRIGLTPTIFGIDSRS